MQQVDGVWLPDGEQHLVEMLTPRERGGRAKNLIRDAEGRPLYQAHKYRAALEHCHGRCVAIDVGGHVGLWAMQMEHDFEHVVSFEPVVRHAEIYPLNMRTDRWLLQQYALGAGPGFVVMTENVESTGDTHVRTVVGGSIEMRSLDSFEIPIVDLLKIDTEGFELKVLEGAAETIERTRPLIVVEQKGKEGDYFGGEADEARLWLEDRGWRAVRPPISGDWFMRKDS